MSVFGAIFYLVTKEGDWAFIIVGICMGILSWAAAIYGTTQYIEHKKWYDTSNEYKIQLKPLFIGLMAVIIIHINHNAMISFLNGIVTGEWQYIWQWGYKNNYEPREWILQAISACVIAPVAEEYFYRGIILKGLSYKYSKSKSIAISTLLFVLIHIPVGRGTFAIVPSIVFGYLYLKYKSLGLCILVHACDNLLLILEPSRNQTILTVIVLVLLFGITQVIQLFKKKQRIDTL